jgi:hypothetical protein
MDTSTSPLPWDPPDEKFKRNLRLRIQHSLAPFVADAKRQHAISLAEVDEDDIVTRASLEAQHEDAMDKIRKRAQDEFDTHLQGEILQRRFVADHKLEPGEWANLQRYQQTLFDHVAKSSPDRERARTSSNEPRPAATAISAVPMVRASSGGTSAGGSIPRDSALLRRTPEPGRRRNDSVASTSSLENQLWSTTRKRAGSTSATGVSGLNSAAIRIPDGPLQGERWTPLAPLDDPAPRTSSRPSSFNPSEPDTSQSGRPGTRTMSRGRGWRPSVSPGPSIHGLSSRTLTTALVDPSITTPPESSYPKIQRWNASLSYVTVAPTSEQEEALSDTPAVDAEAWADIKRNKRPSRSYKTRTAPGSPMLSPSLLNPPQPSPSQSVTLLEARGTPTGSPTPFHTMDLAPPTQPLPSRPAGQPAFGSQQIATVNGRRTSSNAMRRIGRASELGLVEMPPPPAQPTLLEIVSPPLSTTIRMAFGDMGPPAPLAPRGNQQSSYTSGKSITGKRSSFDIPASAPPRPMTFDLDMDVASGTSPKNGAIQDTRRGGPLSSSPGSQGSFHAWTMVEPPTPYSAGGKTRRGSNNSLQISEDVVVPPAAPSVRFRRGSATSVTSPAHADEPTPGTSAPRGIPILRTRRSTNMRDDLDGATPSPRSRGWYGPEPIPEDGSLELPSHPSEPSPRDRDSGMSMSRNGSLRARTSRDYMRNGFDIYGFAGSAGQRRSGLLEGDGSDDEDWPDRRSMSIRSADFEEVMRRDAEATKKEEDLKVKELEADAREEELEAAKLDFAKREEEMRRMEEEVRRLEEVVRQRIQEASRQVAEVTKKEEEVSRKEEMLRKELNEVRREKEEAKRKEEDARRREDDARREREEARTKEVEARKIAEDARLTAQEARKTSEVTKRKEEMMKRKEEAAKKREEELRRKEEEFQRQAQRAEEDAQRQAEAALREAQRKENDIRKREEELARREEDLIRREELQRKEQELFEREQQLRNAKVDQRRPPRAEDFETRRKPLQDEDERARIHRQWDGEPPRHPMLSNTLVEEPLHVGEESLIDDEPLLAPPSAPLLSAPLLASMPSTFEALLEPVTPIDRIRPDSPLADDEQSPRYVKRGTNKTRKRDDKHRRQAEEEQRAREEEEEKREEGARRQAEDSLQLEDTLRRAEVERVQLAEESRRREEEAELSRHEEEEQRLASEEEERRLIEEEEDRRSVEEEERHMLDLQAREADEERRIQEDMEAQEYDTHRNRSMHEEEEAPPFADEQDDPMEVHLRLQEHMQYQRVIEEEAQMRWAEEQERRRQDGDHRQDAFRREQEGKQLETDERLARQLAEDDERERRAHVDRQRRQQHEEARRRAQEEDEGRGDSFRHPQDTERRRREETAAPSHWRRDDENRSQEEDVRRRDDRRRTETAQSYPSAPMTGSTSQTMPRSNAIPIPTNRTSSASSAWSNANPSLAGWTYASQSTRPPSAPTAASAAASARPSYPATGTSPGSTAPRAQGSSGQSPGTGAHPGSGPSRQTPMSESEWARRQAEHAKKQQEQFKRDQERISQDKQAAKAYTKEHIVELFRRHEEQWQIVRSAHKVGWNTFPWPVFRKPTGPEALTTDAVGAYVLSPYYPADPSKSNKDRIKEQIRRWHPDRFDTQLLPKVNEEERELVKEGAGWVVRALSELLTRTNAPTFFD